MYWYPSPPATVRKLQLSDRQNAFFNIVVNKYFQPTLCGAIVVSNVGRINHLVVDDLREGLNSGIDRVYALGDTWWLRLQSWALRCWIFWAYARHGASRSTAHYLSRSWSNRWPHTEWWILWPVLSTPNPTQVIQKPLFTEPSSFWLALRKAAQWVRSTPEWIAVISVREFISSVGGPRFLVLWCSDLRIIITFKQWVHETLMIGHTPFTRTSSEIDVAQM